MHISELLCKSEIARPEVLEEILSKAGAVHLEINVSR